MLLKMRLLTVVFIFFVLFFVSQVFAQNRLEKLVSTVSKENIYRIGSKDKIKIEVWGNPNLSPTVTVRPDGRISMPLLGEIYVVGMQPNDLKEELTRRLSEFINSPEVSVTVLEINSMKIHVFGNVGFAGPNTLEGQTSLLQFFAIKKIPDTIELKKSFIVRDGKKLDIDLYGLIIEGNIEQNINLISGDLIYLMDKEKKKFEHIVVPEKIRIIGEVKNPTSIPYEEGLTVLDALMKAGGCKDEADQSKIKIIRKREGNKVDEVVVNMEKIIDPQDKTSNNVLLKPGDLLVIPSSWFAGF